MLLKKVFLCLICFVLSTILASAEEQDNINIITNENSIFSFQDSDYENKFTKQQEKIELNNQVLEDKKVENTKKVKNLNFVEKWLIPEQNPAFGDDGYAIGVQYSHDVKRYFFPHEDNRELHHFAFQYSSSSKWLGMHGRSSFGLGYLYGQDYWAKYKEEGKYNTPLFEFIQEVIFGNKYVYITFGIGISWVVSAPMDYEWSEEYTGHFGNVKFQNGDNNFNKPTYTDLKYTSAGITKLNIPLTAALGHRFENGLVVEIMWKHYSNGHIQHYNQEINTIGLSLRYTFGKNKK